MRDSLHQLLQHHLTAGQGKMGLGEIGRYNCSTFRACWVLPQDIESLPSVGQRRCQPNACPRFRLQHLLHPVTATTHQEAAKLNPLKLQRPQHKAFPTLEIMADWLPLTPLAATRKDHRKSKIRTLELHRKADHHRTVAIHRRSKPLTLGQAASSLFQPQSAERMVLVAILEEPSSPSEANLLLLIS